MKQYLTTMPRETRDTLLVLGVVILVLLPHLAFLPWWVSALALLILTWRLGTVLRGQALPRKWLLNTLLVLAVAATALQYRTIVGPEAGVVLILLLLVLKTLEVRARRDAMVIFFLGFFTLLTLFLQSQSLLMACAMLLAAWGLLAALVNAHMPAGYPSLGQLLRTSGLLMLLGAPVMLVLFLSFPRFGPLWGLPAQESKARTGLGNQITVGQVAELAQDFSVALRVRFALPDGQTPPQHLLYFRGPVLSHFDGRQWQTGSDEAPMRPSQQATGLGQAVPYELTLEPHHQRWLLTLDATLQQPDMPRRRMLQTSDLQWLAWSPITDVLRYQAQAHLHFVYGQQLSAWQRKPYLQLPADLNPRTLAWAQQLRAQHGADDMAIIQAALTQLRQGGYTYTLSPTVVSSPHTADAFWFDTRDGFCEHISSAFAVLMRAAGIPARLVTGYQGGERNPVDGLWTVRQSDAHAWTEIWLPNEGWLRSDPTTAVAPSRTEQLQRLSPPASAWTGAAGRVMGWDAMQQLRAQWEAINHRWNDWVLNYTRGDQAQLLQRLQLSQNLAVTLATALGCGMALLLAWLGLQRWRQHYIADPWQRLMHRARRRLAQAGIAHADSLGLQALARAVQAQWGDDSRPLQQWLQQMEQWRYAPHDAQTPSLRTLQRHYRALIWPRTS